MSPHSVAKKWEARLKRDGLAHLDYEDGPDDIIVGNRGSGKLDPRYDADAQLRARADGAAQVDRAREILRTYRFPTSRDRRIWALHAEGLGTRAIAAATGHDRHKTVIPSIRRTEVSAERRSKRNGSIEALVRNSSTDFLASLLRAI